MFSSPAIHATVRRIQTPFIIVAITLCAFIAGIVVGTGAVDPLFLLALPVSIVVIFVWQQGSNHYSVGILAIILSGGLINFFTLPTGTDSRIVVSFLVAGGLLGF